jgi:hypothetical protein
MWKAMQALPAHRLTANELENEYDGAVCAIGSVGKVRGVDMSKLDPEDYEAIAGAFGIPHQLAQEIMYLNDECDRGEYVEAHGPTYNNSWQRPYVFIPTTPEKRFERMKKWIEAGLLPVED